MKLYNIYWPHSLHASNSDVVLQACNHLVVTNDVDKWLEENNNQRIKDGVVPEKLSDFEIEEVNAIIYSEEE